MNPSQLEAIFFEALDKPTAQDRDAFLNEACAGDDALRHRLERMFEAQAKSFLNAPPGVIDATELNPWSEDVGTTIGCYKLLQQIGEGGMGVVFMAEQLHPVQRKVALKIIKPGMDTRQVIARFEIERQALALMDHPHIAKVFDAGVVGSASRAEPESPGRPREPASEGPARVTGRPYFVMELVQGVPITEYCDECNLPTRERLELFIDVCQAVQHAHQKGVIHRDIKPTYVLVS